MSFGRSRYRKSEVKNSCSGLASGSLAWTLTLVEMRGYTMSPLIKVVSSAQNNAMCSGAWP